MCGRQAFDGLRGSAISFACFCGALFWPAAGDAQSAVSSFPSMTLRLAPSPASDDHLDEPPTRKEKSAFETISGEVQAIFAKCKGAVVRIEATDAYGPHAGTGFFIDPAGTIYTHYSVAGRSWNLLVEFAGKKYPATCLVADARSGVTILNIQAGLTPFLPLGKSADLRVASAVVAIGYPMDLPMTPTFGLVAGFDQKFVNQYLPTTHIRANVPVQAGESGAPLLNDKGEVVGILVCQFDYGAVCLSLPIRAAEKIRLDYLRFGCPRPGWVGVTAKPANPVDEDAAVRVDAVAGDGPAAVAGLQEGDMIQNLNGAPIRRFSDLVDASFFLTAGATIPITVLRDDREITLSLQATDPPGASMALPPVRDSEIAGPHLRLPVARDPK